MQKNTITEEALNDIEPLSTILESDNEGTQHEKNKALDALVRKVPGKDDIPS